MGGAIALRKDFGAEELRDLATKTKDAKQARRLLALAAVYDGHSRTEAGCLSGMDRQTLRDWAQSYRRILVTERVRRQRLELAI